MEDEIDNLEKDIKKLQEDIRINRPKEEAKKSFYNEIKKPRLAKSVRINKAKKELKEAVDEEQEMLDKFTNFYDSIKKDVEYEKNTPYNEKDNVLKYKELYEKACSFIKDKKFPLVSAYDSAISANRFLVRFEGNVNVPEWYVRRVSFSPSHAKEIYVVT